MQLDTTLTHWIHNRFFFLLPIWVLVTQFGVWGFLLYFSGLWYRSGFEPKYALVVSIAAIGALLAGVFFHYVFRRPRPTFMKIGYTPKMNDFSFPSVHSTVAFALATVLLFIHHDYAGISWKFLLAAIVAIGLAKLIGLSRIVLGVHYVTDIVAGVALGVLVGFLSSLIL